MLSTVPKLPRFDFIFGALFFSKHQHNNALKRNKITVLVFAMIKKFQVKIN
jgi:hypothetical protein